MILIDKSQTVERKCNYAFTEKGVVITLQLGQIDSNFGAKTKLELLICHTNMFNFLTKFPFTNFSFTEYHHEDFVDFSCIGSGHTLPWESPKAIPIPIFIKE